MSRRTANPSVDTVDSVLPSLTSLILNKQRIQRKDVTQLTFSQFSKWAEECVKLHNFLVLRNVPRRAGCGRMAAIAVGSKRRRNETQEPEIECSDDGYIMRIDMTNVWSLGTKNNALAVLVRAVGGVLAPTGVLGDFSWAFFNRDDSLEVRLTRLQEYEQFKLRDWCVYGDDVRGRGQIPLQIFQDDGQPVSAAVLQREKELEDADMNRPALYSFTYSLLMKSDQVFLSKNGSTIAFSKLIDSEAQAMASKLPWVEGQSLPYLYVDLICSRVRGGGAAIMQSVGLLATWLGVRRVYMSALPHVIFLYARKAGAEFVDRTTDIAVEIRDDWMAYEPTLEPLSRAEADFLLENWKSKSARGGRRV